MFFLVPPFAIFSFVCFGLVFAWRVWRQRHLPRRGVGSKRGPFSHLPLVPPPLLRGADRTWVVFTSSDSEAGRAIVALLRTTEPASQVSEIDTRREPRLAEAFQVGQVPALIRANRYGQVEARIIGPAAIETALAELREYGAG